VNEIDVPSDHPHFRITDDRVDNTAARPENYRHHSLIIFANFK